MSKDAILSSSASLDRDETTKLDVETSSSPVNQNNRKKNGTHKKGKQTPFDIAQPVTVEATICATERLDGSPPSRNSISEKSDNIDEIKKTESIKTESFAALPIIDVDDGGELTEVVVADKSSRTKTSELLGTIESLPDELLIRIFSFLSERDLFRTSEVSKHWNRLSFDVGLWEEKSKHWLSTQNMRALKRTRQWFLQHYQEEERWKTAEAERLKRENKVYEDVERYNKRRRKASLCECFLRYAFFTVLSDYVTILLIILGTVFIAIRLDFIVVWRWSLVLIPWYGLMAQLLLAMTFTDVARLIWRDELPNDLAPSRQLPVWKYFMKTGCRLFQHITLWSLVVFLILLAIKETSPNLIPWWAVLLPLAVWALIAMQAPLTGCFAVRTVRSGFYCVERVILSVFAFLFLCFLVLFWLKIEFYILWSWSQVFFPIWLIVGVIFVGPIVIWIAGACSPLVARNSIMTHEVTSTFLLVAICWVALLLPFLVLVGSIIANYQTPQSATSYVRIFIPFYIIEGLALLGCIIKDIVIVSTQ